MLDQTPVADRRRSETFSRCPQAHLQYSMKRFGGFVENNFSMGRDRAHQMMELAHNRFQIRENIGVIVFKVVQNDRAGTIVHKLAALIEESRVIFIGFDHEVFRFGQTGRVSEILRNTADQKTGIQSAVFQNPGQH